MEQTRIEYLAKQYILGLADAEEKAAFLAWVREEKDEALLREILGAQWEQYENPDVLPASQSDRLFQSVLDAARLLQEVEEEQAPVRTLIHWQRWVAAASVIFMVGIGSYFLFVKPAPSKLNAELSQQERFTNDVDPGKYKARLTLSDGSVIILDTVMVGELAKQGGTVVMNKDGQLVYSGGSGAQEVMYNTLSTARGETYATVLADGSKVWLNSASSIQFPVAFNGKERRVVITGEAYFEVAKDSRKKFIVEANGTTTEVIGTHFNVNAYDDESDIKVTLLEGSVKVGNDVEAKIIKPGQQVAVAPHSPLTTHLSPDLEQVMAWKNGRFYFDGTDIKNIMKQVERWYDVEVLYENNINELFVAKISRDVPLSEMLKLLELTNLVHFKVEGKRVTVMR